MLIIKKVHAGYIVARSDDERHSHFKHRGACRQLIKLIDRGLMPTSGYMREAARRVLNEDQFNKLKDQTKQVYINRRCIR